MKKILFLTLFLPFMLLSQNKAIFSIEPTIDKIVSYKANLSEGTYLNDLSWAWDSANACFPETQKNKFTGKHIFFTGIIPAGTETTVTIIPTDKNANFSLYAYQIQLDEDFVVPNLPHCVTCEADHKRKYNRVGKPRQNHTRTISNFIALHNSYRIVIGVTGANKINEGEFIIEIKTEKL